LVLTDKRRISATPQERPQTKDFVTERSASILAPFASLRFTKVGISFEFSEAALG
jgi:hypothetical protein